MAKRADADGGEGGRRARLAVLPRQARWLAARVGAGPNAADAGIDAPRSRPGFGVAVPGWAGLVAVARRHWVVAGVLTLYALSALVVPVMTPALVSDDWIFVRSVETLVREGELEIVPLSAPTAVFQVVWGALFASVFGLSFGALRLSTVVLVWLSGWALYDLLRQVGVSPGQAALGTAVYLFNPLLIVLGFSFMTDAPFTALLVIATALYGRGLRRDAAGTRFVVAGSVVAALAFLVRPHGALIPFAVVVSLLGSRRVSIRPRRAGLLLLLRVAAIPAAAVLGYYLWAARGVPSGQRTFTAEITGAGWDESRLLVQRMTFVVAMYLGCFALPVAIGALRAGPRLVRSIPAGGWVLFTLWEALIVAGLALFGAEGRRMPYVSQFVAPWGLGPSDMAGGGTSLVDPWVLDAVTAGCAAGALVLGLVLCRGVGAAATPERGIAGVVLAIGVGQVLGVLPPSFPFRDWTLSLDRYLLPLLPFAVCLGLWAVRELRFSLPAAWLVAAAFAVFAVAGTRDFLVMQEATWGMGRKATDAGVPLTQLDGGYAWDGYHLWGTTETNPNAVPPLTGPCWVWWWTPGGVPATDSTYIVALGPVAGYDEVLATPYSSWLRTEPTQIRLLRRQGASGPL